MSSLPTLTPGFQAPAECMTSTNIWRWIIAGNSQFGVLGSPEQTDSCFPPSYDPTGALSLLSATGCPTGYLPACDREEGTLLYTTCCPE